MSAFVVNFGPGFGFGWDELCFSLVLVGIFNDILCVNKSS